MQSGVSETQLFGLWHDSGIVTVNGTATISVSNDATDIAMGYAFDSIHDNERPTPSPRQTTFTDTASISASSSVDGAWAAGIYMRANALDKPSLTFKKDAEISAHAASGEAGGIILNYSDYDSNNSTDGAKGGSVVFEDTSALTVDVSGKVAVGVLVDVGSLVVNGKADIKASSTENEYGIVIRGHGKATFNGETEVTATNALVLTPEDELDGLDWANDEIYNYGYQTSRHPVAEFKGTTTLNGALKQSSGTTINNTGTMTVKGDAMIAGTISGETGTLTLTTGTVTGNVIQDAIYVKGGSVILADSGHIEAKRIEIQSGKLTLEGAASLKTSSDQIFDAGLGIDGTVDNARNKKWGENLVFTGGTLTLTDEKYNASYADSVKGLIGSGTKVTYLGELVGGLTLDQAASIGGVHANTEIDAKGNVSDGKVSVDADVGGKTINVGSASKVEVTSNTTMTLVGNSGDELIIFSGTDDKAVDIQGTLKLGSVSVETSGKLTSTVNVEGTVAVENGSFDLTKLTTGTTSSTTAAIEVNKGSLNVGTLELNNGKATISVSDDAKMKVDELAAKAGEHIITGAVEVGKLAQDAAEALIRIGTTGENGESGLKGALTIAKGGLNGLKFFLDPTWVEGKEVTDASSLRIAETNVDGQIVVGQNSYVSLGTTDDSAFVKLFKDGTLTWGKNGTLAAVYVAQPITISSVKGSLTINADLTENPTGTNAPAAGSVTFAKDSVLVANVENFSNNAVVITADSFEIDSTSKAVVIAKTGQTFQLTSDDEVNKNYWNKAGDTLISANKLVSFNVGADGKISTEAEDAEDVFAGLMQGAALANAGAASDLAAAAGVQAAALQGLGLATDTAQKRASLSQTFVDGVTSFAEVSGTRLDLGGNSSMNEINAELGGVIVGGEWTRSDMTFGGLANLGSGSVRGQSVNAGVKNDVDYYGASLYAGKRFGQFNLVGQAGYLRTSNDLTDSSVGYAKADSVKTNVWTIGVRGEAAVQLYENSQLIPYVGLTYVRLNTDDYTVSNGTHVSSTHQNLWTVPVGLMFTGKTAAASGWNLQPLLDVAYVRSFGDKDVEATTTWGSTVGSVDMDVWAENVLRSRAGIEAQKGALSLGIQGGAACGSDNMSSFFAQVSARYSF